MTSNEIYFQFDIGLTSSLVITCLKPYVFSLKRYFIFNKLYKYINRIKFIYCKLIKLQHLITYIGYSTIKFIMYNKSN